MRIGVTGATGNVGGMRDRAGADSPPLDPRAGGPLRVSELLSGVGRVNP